MLIADAGGGSVRAVASAPAASPAQQPPANTGASDAAARAAELERQLEALLEKLREAQRQAEEARKRAIEAQKKADEAKAQAEALAAQRTKSQADADAAKKAQQDYQLQDARAKQASADANLKDKDVSLLRAQVTETREQKKSPDGQASAATQQKVKDAQGDRDGAQKTSDLSNLYADSQEKESKAQDAQAAVRQLAPNRANPIGDFSPEESKALSDARSNAATLRADADAAHGKFADAVGAQADSQFYGAPAPVATPVVAPGTQPVVFANDPLHSPLTQLLQVAPQFAAPPSANTGLVWPPATTSVDSNPLLYPPTTTITTTTPNTFTTKSPFDTFLPPLKPTVVTPQVTQTLNGIADGKSVEQIASERHMRPDQVVAEANAAGVKLTSGLPSQDAQTTTIQRGNATLAYTHDAQHGTTTVKASFADPSVPGGRKTTTATEDSNGRYSQTTTDAKTGDTTTRTIDTQAGTATTSVVDKNGLRTDTTTDLAGAAVTHTVADGESYRDVATAAGLTPEQLRILNPTVDYGKPLQPGQQMVVTGVQTTVKTFNKDGTMLEQTTGSDGSLQAVATSASGHRTVLAGIPDAKDPQGEAARKGIFDDKKSVADVAASMGLTQDQVLALLPSGTVDDGPASADTHGIERRTLYDPTTNHTVIETLDPHHDRYTRQDITDGTVFTRDAQGKPVPDALTGGVAYAQQQADDKAALAADYGKQIADLNSAIRLAHRTGDSASDLLSQRNELMAAQKKAQADAGVEKGKATATLIKYQQQVVDQQAPVAYQNLMYARPGSPEQAQAGTTLKSVLDLSDKIDRLVPAADKAVAALKAGVNLQQKQDAKTAADDKLQTEFENWKDNVWMWANVPPDTAAKMKAAGEKPGTRIFADPQQEHDAAWEAFVSMQKDIDQYGTDDLPADNRVAHDAWVQRNQASDAALQANVGFDDASVASQAANTNVTQGDLDRLTQDRDAWTKANPNDLPLNFPGQKVDPKAPDQPSIDGLTQSLIDGQVDALKYGEDKKHTQYLLTVSAPDRADPDALKSAEKKYADDNGDALSQLKTKIRDMQGAPAREQSKMVTDYINASYKRNPELKAQLDKLGTTSDQSSLRAAEYRSAQIDALLSASEQGQQLQSAFAMRDMLHGKFDDQAAQDQAQVQSGVDEVKKDIDKHSFVRDAWGAMFGDSSDGAKQYSQDALDHMKQLRSDLASGKISVSDFAQQEKALMDDYDLKSGQLQRDMLNSDGTWSVVDEAVRSTVMIAAGIGGTLLTGGNLAAGFGAAMLAGQLWDTTGDVVASAQGHDIAGDGHESLLGLGWRAASGDASWGETGNVFKGVAVDAATSAVNMTGLGIGGSISARLGAQFAARETLQVAGRDVLSFGAKGTLNWTGRAVVGARAGLSLQAVDGAGRVGVETLHVGLDGQLGTEEGDKRIGSTIVSSAVGLVTAPVTGAVSGAIPMGAASEGVRPSVFGAGVTARVANDAAGALAGGELISLVNNGRSMNQGEFIAASLQTVPGVLNHVATHPTMAAWLATRGRNAPGNADTPDASTAPATTPRVEPPVAPVAKPIDVNTASRNLPGLADRGVDNLKVVDVNTPDLTQGIDVQTHAAAALAPGGVVEFHIALDNERIATGGSDPAGITTAAYVQGKDGTAAPRPGEDARQARQRQEQQDTAIRVRLRGVGLDNVKITRNPNPGARRPEIVVQATKPSFPGTVDRPLARPVYDGYDQRADYLTGSEMTALYGSGTRGPKPTPPADFRVAMTMRNRLATGQYEPIASPTMQSMSIGIGTRSNLKAIAYGLYDSVIGRSLTPVRNAFGTEASVAIRPDEYRRTSFMQWGVLPFSRDTIFTVFSKDLMGAAKQTLFGKGTPGYGVNMRSAQLKGPAAKGPGQVVEVELSVKLDGEKLTLPADATDFFGGSSKTSPDGHVKVPSSLLFDRVIEDLRVSPLLPILKKALGYTGLFTPSVERRWQMMLRDVVREGDVVPKRFFEQFQKTFGDAKYRMQVVVPDTDGAKLYNPVERQIADFVKNPTPARLQDMVAQGLVDPDKAIFFVPERGGNHHRTAVPGKALSETFDDLAGQPRRVPNRDTSNVWVIFTDHALERNAQRVIYRTKKALYGMLPEWAQKSQPSTHHVPGQGNLINALTGPGRELANPSARRTAVFALKMPTVFQTPVLAGSVEFRFQAGSDEPALAKAVAKGRTDTLQVAPDSSDSVDVPQWFPRALASSLNGPTPVIPKGGRAQIGRFLDDLEGKLGPAQKDAVIGLRERYMEGPNPLFADGKFLRAPVANDIVEVLAGLQPQSLAQGTPRTLMGDAPEAISAARAQPVRPAGLRRADLNYLDGQPTVNGRPVSAADIELAVPPEAVLVMADRANPPSAERIAADLRAGGHPAGKDVVIYLCDAGTATAPRAPVPDSLARDLSDRIGARVHAVDGAVTLGAQTTLGGPAVTARPNLPLTDVSATGRAHPDADHAAQQAFWFKPGGPEAPVDAPFAPQALAKGAWVGDEPIDPLHLGIEDRVADLRPMDADNARAVFPLLAKELGVSPDYNALGAQGMIDKWLGEIANGTRHARVIYPAAGSTLASDVPIGLISVHKEALIGDSYRNTLPAALYRGNKPAGEMSRQGLQDLGEVWQFSTYLGKGKDLYPSGVINKAARMQFMNDVVRQEAAKGMPVTAFYSRVNGGAPFITGSDGVTTLLKGHAFNVKSAFSQQSQTVGRGPIAVGYEDSSPFKSKGYEDGEPARHIYIYETDASLYGPEGLGTLKWRGKIEEAFDSVDGSRSLLGAVRPANLNYLEGEATVNGQPVPARDIQVAVPPDTYLVMADASNLPATARLAADMRANGYRPGQDVALYVCRAGERADPAAPVPASAARDLANALGARVQAHEAAITLGNRNTVGEGQAVTERPSLPLTDVSTASRAHPDADHAAQQAFWLAPGGRSEAAPSAFSPEVLGKGAWAGDKTIDPLHLGIEDRAVELVPFDVQHARDVLPYLTHELRFSPEFTKLGAQEMAKKWAAEIEDGNRMAYVIYPAPGSAVVRRPLGIIAIHKGPLVSDSFIGIRPADTYPGAKPAGEMSREALGELGPVWQFSTYLIKARTSSKSSFPGGVVNTAAKKQIMATAVQELARRGEPIDAFYAAVHAGAPEAVPEMGWPKDANVPSLKSQERMAGDGPITVVHQAGPPRTGDQAAQAPATRYIAIFKTPVSRFDEGGTGTAEYRSLLDSRIAGDQRPQRWLGPQEWQNEPLVHRRADLNYLEGNVTVDGRPVPASDIEVAVPSKAFLVMADEANVPSAEQIAADMRAAGYPEGQDVALYICRAGKLADPKAVVPESLAHQLGDTLGARVHAVEGTIELGGKTQLGDGHFVTGLPKLPLLDVSTGRAHPGENFDTAQRFWLAPNGRGERVDAPLGAAVRNMGAKAGENFIDPYVLGIEDRVVRLAPFDAHHAGLVLPTLAEQLAVSPDFKNGPEGLAHKWLGEMDAGTRMAYVIYPAEGSPLPQTPLGLVALHREPLVDEKYVKTLSASYYTAGKFPAREVSREDLVAKGDVWQFSTYLNSDGKGVPGTNKAGKMLTIDEVAAESQRRGDEILAFYARVHGGGPLVLRLQDPGVNPNISSLFGQESMAQRGPIAVGLEQGSPVTGGADRYVLIFETPRSLYLPDGAGRAKWTGDLQKLIDKHPDPASWLGAEKDTGSSGVMLSRKAAPAEVDWDRAQPVALRSSDGDDLSAHRLMVTDADGTRRPMTGTEVLDRMGTKVLGRGVSADVYPFGDDKAIKIFRTEAEDYSRVQDRADLDLGQLREALPDGATIDPAMGWAHQEKQTLQELADHVGEHNVVDVSGPYLVGNRLVLVMPRYVEGSKALTTDSASRTFTDAKAGFLNERTASSAGSITDEMNTSGIYPSDPQFLVHADGSVVLHDPDGISRGSLARKDLEHEAAMLARTGRHNAAARPAPDTPDAGTVQFAVGPAPDDIGSAGGLRFADASTASQAVVHDTVAAAKWAAIEPWPAPHRSEAEVPQAAYVYTVDGGSMQTHADGTRTISLDAIIAGRQVDAFGRFVPEQSVRFRVAGDAGSPDRQVPKDVMNLLDPGSAQPTNLWGTLNGGDGAAQA